jgi:hypothetical protein
MRAPYAFNDISIIYLKKIEIDEFKHLIYILALSLVWIQTP